MNGKSRFYETGLDERELVLFCANEWRVALNVTHQVYTNCTGNSTANSTDYLPDYDESDYDECYETYDYSGSGADLNETGKCPING